MSKFIPLLFKCPKCGCEKLFVTVEYEAEVTNLSLHTNNAEHNFDVRLHYMDNKFVCYGEGEERDMVTKHYLCAKCRKKFKTIDDVIELCDTPDGRIINGIYVPNTLWTLQLSETELDDIKDSQVFEVNSGKHVIDVVKWICTGKLFDTYKAAALELNIDEKDVRSHPCCIPLKSTGRVIVF